MIGPDRLHIVEVFRAAGLVMGSFEKEEPERERVCLCFRERTREREVEKERERDLFPSLQS